MAVQEQEHAGEQSRMRALTTELLLQQLPMLQRLMNRLIDCKPTGASCQDHVVQVSLTLPCELPCLRPPASSGEVHMHQSRALLYLGYFVDAACIPAGCSLLRAQGELQGVQGHQ